MSLTSVTFVFISFWFSDGLCINDWVIRSRSWDSDCIISASLHTAKRLWDGAFACPMCPSPHVSSDNMADWIRMPFGVVSGVGLGMGVLDFGGDRWRGRGSLGVNTMQKWHIDRLSTRVWKVDNISLCRMYPWILRRTEGVAVLAYIQVQDRIGGCASLWAHTR